MIGAGYPLPVPAEAAMGYSGAGPIAPGELEITTQLQVVYAIVSGAAAARPSILSPEEYAQTATPAPTPTPPRLPTSGDGGGVAPTATLAAMPVVTVPIVKTTPFPPRATPAPTPTPVREGAAESETSASSAVVVEERVVEAPYPASAPPASQPADVTIVGGDAETLREFVRRWLAPSYAGGATDITLLLGELPADLPFDLPLPEDATVVGSLVRKNDTDYTQILLDVDQPAEEALDTFIQALGAQGFSVPRQDTSPSSIFVSSDPYQSNTLCHAEDDVAVSISATEVSDGATDVRLNVQRRKDYSPCQVSYPRPAQPYADLLPQLTAPADTRVRTSGGGRGTGYVEARAELTSELSAEALAEHYNAQLANAGWEQIDASQAGPIAWSAWTTTDEDGDEWVATFYIVRRAGEPDQYLATLRAERR